MAIPYSWYIQNYTPTSFDESGKGIYQPMSEAEWANLPEQYQQQAVNNNPQGGNGFYDQDLARRFEAAVGPRPAGYERGMSAVRPRDNQGFVDPSKVWTDPQSGMQFTWDENYTPESQNIDKGFFGERPWLTGIGTVLGAGMLNNYGLSGNPFSTGGADISMELGVGSTPGAGGPSALGGPSELASVGESGGTMLGGGSPVNAAVYPNTFLGNAGLALHNATGGLTGAFGGGDLLSGLGGGASGLLSGVLSNPLGLLGAVQAGRGLLGGGNTPSGGGSDSKGGDGSPLAVTPASRGQFTPNPYTQAQIQNYQPVIPGRY